MMKTLYQLFLGNIRENQLIEAGDTIILGFSGGKDSVTLFHLLKELRKDISFHLIAAYFNHRMRTDAMGEEEWVRNFCAAQGVELVTGSRDVIAFRKEAGLNLEHAASLSRYRFFQRVASKYKNAKTATAHTRSDLTETFFIKLFRGSGLQGLSAVFHKKENTIIRPLLLFSQEEILAFLERNEIEFYEDYTNRQEDFLRNRIRLRLVPEIEKIEPQINRHVFRTVSIIQEEYDYFSGLALEVLAKELILGRVLPAAILKNYHLAVQRHIVREYIRLLKGDLLDIGFDHIEAVRTGHAEMRGLAIPGIELTFHKGFIFPRDFFIPPYNYQMAGPGILEIAEIGKKLVIKKTGVYKKPKDNNQVVIPGELVVFPLTVRSPVKGDKYIKINTEIRQKVFEMIRASGIPSELRNLCPVVVNGDGEIMWVLGSPVAEVFKVKDSPHKEYLTFLLA